MNLSEQPGWEERGRPWQLDVRSFHNQGRFRTSDSLHVNPLLTHTHRNTGRQVNATVFSNVWRYTDKMKFTAERRDVVVEIPMTRAAGIWRGDMHRVQP